MSQQDWYVKLSELLLTLAARPQGAMIAEACHHGYTPEQFARGFVNELRRKTLISARVGSKRATYFTTQEAAQAAKKARQRPVIQVGTIDPTAGRSRAALWPPGTVAVYPTNPDGTPAYRHTICPPTQAGRTARTTTHAS